MEQSTHDQAEVLKTTLSIGGMSCGACVRHVSRALDGMIGVVHVEVDLARNEATVQHLPAFTDVAALVAAVRDAGYAARLAGTRHDARVSRWPDGSAARCGCGCCAGSAGSGQRE